MSNSLTKAAQDPYAYYDQWGNRYIAVTSSDYLKISRLVEYLEIVAYFRLFR